MLEKIYRHKWFFISFFLAVLLAFLRHRAGVTQQDNYISYASYLPFSIRNISFYDSRLFPGLPILIYLANFIFHNSFISGYFIVLASFAWSYVILYKITRSRLSILPLIFPPILLNLGSLIDTELPFIFLMLSGLWFFKKEKYWLAFLILGFSVWFRLLGVVVLGGIFVYLFLEKKLSLFFRGLPFFAFPVVLFLLYNSHFYGPQGLFYQLSAYEALHPGRISMGLAQLFTDLVRSYRWGWFRIFVSGLAYIVLYTYLWLKSLGKNTAEFWIATAIYIFILSVNLVPFLENLGRYLAPAVPLFWVMFHKEFKNQNWPLALLPLSFLVVLV